MTENLQQTIHAHALGMSGVESRILDHGEKLVGFGFRSWLSGYRDGGADCWQRCWDFFCQELGSRDARLAIADLSDWVNAIRCTSLREIELLPAECRSFCRDECLAVTLVAASEHRACPALRVCACALLGAEATEPVLSTAHRFNRTLNACGVLLEQSLVSSKMPATRH